MAGNLPIEFNIPISKPHSMLLPIGMPNMMPLKPVNIPLKTQLPQITTNPVVITPSVTGINIPVSSDNLPLKPNEVNLQGKTLFEETEDLAAQAKMAVGDFAQNMTPLLHNFGAALPAALTSIVAAMSANQEASLLGILSILFTKTDYSAPPYKKTELEERIKKIQERLVEEDESCGLSVHMILPKYLKSSNIDFAEECLDIIEEEPELSFEDKYSLFICSLEKSKNEKLRPLIKKVLAAGEDKLSAITKESYLDLVEKNPEFAEELLNSDKIRGEDKRVILNLPKKFINSGFIQKIMNNEKFTAAERASIIQQAAIVLSKWNFFEFLPYSKKCEQVIEEILANEKADPAFTSDIVGTLKKSNTDIINEVIENDNIHSCDKFEVIDYSTKNTMEYSRENIFNNPHINSCDMFAIISRISKADKELRKVIKDKLLYNDKIKSCDIANFISEIKRKKEINPEYMDYVLNDDNIPSQYKGMMYYCLEEDNLEWIKQISTYEDKEMVTFLTACEKRAYDKEAYRKKVIDFLENKCSKEDLLFEIISEERDFVKNAFRLRENPRIRYFDLNPILHSTNENILNEFLNDNYTSIVKEFPQNTPENEILQKTKESDVIQIGEQLYINDGDKLFKWNMTKEACDKLFPPFKRFATNQGNIGNCYLIAVLISLMNSPKGRKYLYKSFSQEGNDILCTIRAYKDYGGTKRFENGEIPEATTMVDACKGLQMLERTYAEVALLENDEVNHPQTAFLKTLDRICGGFDMDAIMDLTGAQKTYNIEKNFKHKVAEFPHKKITREFLKKYVNSKNNCCFIDFSADSRIYDVMSLHAYILDSYNVLEDKVILIDPHDSLSVKKLSYDVFSILLNSLTICNLEEE